MTCLVFDTETTGAKDPEVVEAAWLELDRPPEAENLGEWCERFQPSKPIELGALATHHILEAELVGCPPAATCQLPPGTAYIVGHQVDFDWGAVGKPAVRRIDTMAMAARIWPQVGKASLGAVLYHVLPHPEARERLRGAHGALQDCRNTLVVLQAILRQLPVLDWWAEHYPHLVAGCRWTWETVWRFSEDARVPDVFTFGKHKDLPIAKAPRSYLEWILREPDFDPYVVVAVKRALGLLA